MEIVLKTSDPDGMGCTNTTATVVHNGVTWAQIWSDGNVTLHGPAPDLADARKHYEVFQPEILRFGNGAVLTALLSRIAVLEKALSDITEAIERTEP